MSLLLAALIFALFTFAMHDMGIALMFDDAGELGGCTLDISREK